MTRPCCRNVLRTDSVMESLDGMTSRTGFWKFNSHPVVVLCFYVLFFLQEHPYFADSPSGNLFVWRLVPTQIGFGVSLLCCKDGIVERLVRPPYIPTGECPCDGVPQVCWHCCTEIRCCEDVWSLHYDLSGRKSARTNGGGRRPLHELVLCW